MQRTPHLPLNVQGMPHRLVQDDVYDGYFIPKGSVVFTNVWYDVLFIIKEILI